MCPNEDVMFFGGAPRRVGGGDGGAARARIFVKLAAYRDPECQPTIEDALAKAEHPERVFFGICWQYERGTDPAVPAPAGLDQVRFVRVLARESGGVCWARFQAERLWRGEEYVLQVDSHSRFAPGWDARLIAELARCDSPRPVLSTRPACYWPPDRLEESPPLMVVCAAPFNDDGTLHFRSHALGRVPDAPVRGAFVVGGFVFSRSEILREVPYDPHLYFNQEEAAYGLRLFTHGWDLFSPTQVVLYHYYNPGGPQTATVRPLHWNDSPNWARLDQVGLHRYYHLTGVRPSTDPRVTAELDRFGLGRARSVAQFEAYAGVDFRDRRVLERAFRGEVAAPVPIAAVATPGAAAPPTTVAIAAAAHAQRRPPRFAPARADASLRPGAFVPALSFLDAAARTHEIRRFAGAPTALFVLPAGELGGFARFFAELDRHQEGLRGLQPICVTPLPPARLKIIERRLGFVGRLWSDPDRRVSRLFGADAPGSSKVRLTSSLLGPDLRLVESWRSGGAAEQIRRLAAAAAPLRAAPAGTPVEITPPIAADPVREAAP